MHLHKRFECLLMVFYFLLLLLSVEFERKSSLTIAGNHESSLYQGHIHIILYYSNFSVFRFIYLFIFLSHFQVGYNR